MRRLRWERVVAVCLLVNQPVMITATYQNSTGQVSYFVNQTAFSSFTLGTSNQDNTFRVGGFQGMLFDVQVFNSLLMASDVSNLAYLGIYGYPNYLPPAYGQLFG